jgi:hypothetical protein
MIGEPLPEPVSLYNRSVAGRSATSSAFDIDVSNVTRLWLVVQENGSNDVEMVQPAWAQAELSGPSGTTPLSSLRPVDDRGLRSGDGPIRVPNANGEGVRVKNPSVIAYDIGGRGFTRFRGVMGLENKVSDIGSTLDPQTRFYIFDAQPNLDRLVPPLPGAPLPAPAALTSKAAVVDRVFWHLLGRAPSDSERRIALAAISDQASADRPSAAGVADLLWALMMKPEFQLIY